MKEIYIFGHKKPDTDTVTSAIALSYLKNQQGMNTVPKILGKINKETEFALNYFNVTVPEYLDDVKLQIKDLNYYKDCYVKETDSLNKAYKYMNEQNITGIPVVDSNKKLKGIVTSKMIGSELMLGDFTHLKTSYKNILEVLEAEEILKFDDEIVGTIIAASYRSTTFLNTLELNNDTIMIVGDRHSLIEAAILSKIKLLIIVGNKDIKEEHIMLAKLKGVNIIRTHYDTYHTAKLINFTSYIGNLLSDIRNVSFKETDYYDDFKEKCIKLGYNNYPVVDKKNKCLGLVRITDINELNRKQVILVDHNESSQSVEGLEEAEILEIIDHHKIGAVTTSMPINFRNMTVGSTNTILFLMYSESKVEIPAYIAGIMLSGILSDTLKFTSPTTTEYDKYAALSLANISNIDIDDYSSKLFKAGTNLEGKTLEEIIEEDLKIFEIDNKRVAVSQVLSLNPDDILDKKLDYIAKLDEMKNNKEYDLFVLCITDIIKGGSYIFYDTNNEDLIREAFSNNDLTEGYFLPDCLSRKKQIVPNLMNVL